MVDAGGGKIALIKNNGFVSSEKGNAPLTGTRISISNIEKFYLITNADGTILLRESIGLFISSEDGTGALTCNKPAVDES